jgi:peptide/nickel transport system permease protein
MSIESAVMSETLQDAKALQQPAAPVPRSLGRQAVVDTFSRIGARVGLAWLLILAICAVFGPFISSSHPVAMKVGGHWSSPMLVHLTPPDVLVLIAAFLTVILAIGRWVSFARGLMIVIVAVIALVAPAYWLVRPPVNIDYSRYRTLTAQGKIEAAIYTLNRYSPSDRNSEDHLVPPGGKHWFGTDTDGADVFSNILRASRVALSVGFIATGISVLLGIVFGGLMGYFVGVFDLINMRIIEVIEALPRLILLVTISALIPPSSRTIYVSMAIIGLTGYTTYARFVRAEFLSLRKRDFVQAAIAAGYGEPRIIFRHLLPNGLTPVLVTTTFGVGSAILYEAMLSFLGLGQVDQPSWGSLLQQARAGGTGFIWWIAMFPGIAIFLTVFSYNLIGEAARDALDPKLRKRD